MPTVQAQGLTTAYEKVGSGPPLLLLHGWANTWESWLPVIPSLSDHCTLFIPDLPGCGKTGTPSTGWSTPQHVNWLEDFLQQLIAQYNLSAADFSLCGHSYGGKILIFQQSGKTVVPTKKLILIDASGIPNNLTQKQKMLRLFSALSPKIIKENLPQSVRAKLYTSFGADSDYLSATPFQRQTLKIILKEDVTPLLAHISAATLLLWGTHDTATPLWQAQTMDELIPLSQLKTFAAGHFLPQEHPEQVAKEILEFLT